MGSPFPRFAENADGSSSEATLLEASAAAAAAARSAPLCQVPFFSLSCAGPARERAQNALLACANTQATFEAAEAAASVTIRTLQAGGVAITTGELITAAAKPYIDAIIERCDPETAAAAAALGDVLFVDPVKKSLGSLPSGLEGVVLVRSACGRDEHRAGTHQDYSPILDVASHLTDGKIALVDIALRLTACIRAGAPGAKGGYCAKQTREVVQFSTQFIKFVFAALDIPILGVVSLVAVYDARCLVRDFGDCVPAGAVLHTAVVLHYRYRLDVSRFGSSSRDAVRTQNALWFRQFAQAVGPPLGCTPEAVYKCVRRLELARKYELPADFPPHVVIRRLLGYGGGSLKTYGEWHAFVRTARAGGHVPSRCLSCLSVCLPVRQNIFFGISLLADDLQLTAVVRSGL